MILGGFEVTLKAMHLRPVMLELRVPKLIPREVTYGHLSLILPLGKLIDVLSPILTDDAYPVSPGAPTYQPIEVTNEPRIRHHGTDHHRCQATDRCEASARPSCQSAFAPWPARMAKLGTIRSA